MGQLGFGQGLQGAADALMQWAQMRFQGQQRDKDREIADKRAVSQDEYYKALAENQRQVNVDRVADNEQKQAEFVAKYFGGAQNLPPEAVQAIPERLRGVMLKTEQGMGQVPAPEGLPGAPATMEAPVAHTSIRQPVTSSERTATINADSRGRAEAMRQRYLYDKLAQDKELAGMTDARMREALNRQLAMAAERVALGYANIDQRTEEMIYKAEADAIIEKFKADTKAQNPIFGLIMQSMGQQPGAPAAPAPAQAAPVAPPTPPRPPRVRGAGAAPATDPSDPLGIRPRP